MSIIKRTVLITILFALTGAFFSRATQANAYSIYGPTGAPSAAAPPAVRAFGDLIPSLSSQDIFRARMHNALRVVDEWLYGEAGFHIGNFFLTILGIFSWLLGIIKGGVDWLLGLFY